MHNGLAMLNIYEILLIALRSLWEVRVSRVGHLKQSPIDG